METCIVARTGLNLFCIQHDSPDHKRWWYVGMCLLLINRHCSPNWFQLDCESHDSPVNVDATSICAYYSWICIVARTGLNWIVSRMTHL